MKPHSREQQAEQSPPGGTTPADKQQLPYSALHDGVMPPTSQQLVTADRQPALSGVQSLQTPLSSQYSLIHCQGATHASPGSRSGTQSASLPSSRSWQ